MREKERERVRERERERNLSNFMRTGSIGRNGDSAQSIHLEIMKKKEEGE